MKKISLVISIFLISIGTARSNETRTQAVNLWMNGNGPTVDDCADEMLRNLADQINSIQESGCQPQDDGFVFKRLEDFYPSSWSSHFEQQESNVHCSGDFGVTCVFEKAD